MRNLALSVCFIGVTMVHAQTFTEVAAGQVNVGKVFGMKDSCTVTVGAFSLSSPISIGEYQAYLDYFLALSDSNTFATSHVDKRTNVLNEEAPMTSVSWTSALAYCDWLAGRPENQGWKIRMPLLSEWLLARQVIIIDDAGIRTWLMNAKDEAALDCRYFDYQYDAKPGDSFALRRKVVVGGNDRLPNFGIGENFWQDMSYPNVGFRVVRYK